MMNGSITWLIYLEQGKLIYAWNSIDPFDRLTRHLNRLPSSCNPPIDPIQIQIQLLAETSLDRQFCLGSDYQTICWLVKHEYLSENQAATFIEQLAIEVIESLLMIKESNYHLLELDNINKLPIFCQLDPTQLIENCRSDYWRNPSIRVVSQLQPNPQTLHHQVKNEKIQDSDRPFLQSSINSAIAPYYVAPPSTQPTTSQYTIVCIDDSPIFLEMIDAFLQHSNFSVLTIADPLKALIDLVQSKPNLILLDVNMPSLDGYELCSLLRRHPFFQQIPVIMVTGYTRLVDRARAELVGASDYLTKPFTRSELLHLVSKHLS